MKHLIETYNGLGLRALNEQIHLPSFSNSLPFPESAIAFVLRNTNLNKIISLALQFNDKVLETSVGVASSNLLEKLRIGVKLDAPIPSEIKRQGNPMLIVGNHDGYIEPIVTWALLERPDQYIIGGREAAQFGNEIAQHLLPVRPIEFANERSVVYGKAMSRKEIDELNRRSLQKAGEVLMRGEAVTIYPTGRRKNIDQKWKYGLGRIIEKIPEGQRKLIRLLPVHFSQFHKADFLSLLTELALCGKVNLKRQIHVQVGELQTLFDLVGNEVDVKIITNILQQYYDTQNFPE